MKLSQALVLAYLAAFASALTPDPAGEKNVGNGQGKQFITGACLSNADCASACCARLNGGGICSGPAVAFAQGKQGCGFVSGGGNTDDGDDDEGDDDGDDTAASPSPTVPANTGSGLKPDPAGDKNIGNGQGKQFITGACLSNADCASTCCARLNGGGICSGPAVAFSQGKQGCGFVGTGAGNGGNTDDGDDDDDDVAAPSPTAAANTGSGLKPDPAGDKNIGNGRGEQFITGACLSNADCASTCCARLNGGGICSGPAVAFAQGKQGCGFVGTGAGNDGNDDEDDDDEDDVAAPSPTAAANTGSGLKPDPAGDKNIGNGRGEQFITGACLSNADCASTCCARLNGGGICSGPAVAFAQGKQGCGFVAGNSGNGNGNGNGQTTRTRKTTTAPSPTPAANTGNTSGLKPDPAGDKNIGNGQGKQFITGACLSNADCASTCCARLNGGGICSGPAVAFAQGKQGCGFVAGAAASKTKGRKTKTSTAAGSQATGSAVQVVVDTNAAGSANVGNGQGKQFITGQCIADADCASGCCAKPKGACSGPAVAFDAGKQGCGFVGVIA